MRSLLVLSLAPFLFAGCGDKDSDGDGLTDDQEETFGTSSEAVDSDEDGLTDKEEFDLGTDGTEIDSDADGYNDLDEVNEGSDPTDSDSMIYAGGWPYYADKDSISDPGFGGSTANGETIARFAWPDQFGDTVDIYDFAYQGVPVIIDVSGMWCYYCNEMAKWLEGKNNGLEDYYGQETWFQEIPEMVENGDLIWVTVLDSDWNGRGLSEEELVEWYEEYPHEKVAILGDMDGEMVDYLELVGYPTLLVLNEDMTIEKLNSDYSKVLDKAYNMASE